MYRIKDDQRSVRSAETIYAALLTLMDDKPFEAIKVSELVTVAEIGRATFYRNFDLLEDVLLWRCEQVTNELFMYFMEYRRSNRLSAEYPLLKPLLRFFYLHSDIVELLIKANRVDMLQSVILERITKIQSLMTPPIDVPKDYLEYGNVLRSSMMVGVLVHWVKTGKRQAPDELADGLIKMAPQMQLANSLIQ